MQAEPECPIIHKNDNKRKLAMKGKLPYIKNEMDQLKVKRGNSKGYNDQLPCSIINFAKPFLNFIGNTMI